MKRIANKVAVATICYTICGSQKIRVQDYENDYDLIYRKNPKIVYDGFSRDFGGYRLAKYTNAQCRGVHADGDTIVFDVCTVFEEY